MSWRCGRSLGRTLYRDDKCVGMMDTAELAQEVVYAFEVQNRARMPQTDKQRVEAMTAHLERWTDDLALTRHLEPGWSSLNIGSEAGGVSFVFDDKGKLAGVDPYE